MRLSRMALIKHRYNPFFDELEIETKTQSVKVASLGKSNVIVNQDTGEISGTHVRTYRKVDSAQFVKLFTQNIGLTFDLTSAGLKAFNVLMWCVQRNGHNKDELTLDSYALEDFIEDNNGLTLSLRTLRRGLTELCNANILAKSVRVNSYYLNPSFVFNGDRIAFTSLIEREDRAPNDQGSKCPNTRDWIEN